MQIELEQKIKRDMNIEERIEKIARKHFSECSYIVGEWYTIDNDINRVELPAIAYALPTAGTIRFDQAMRVINGEQCQIAFVDKVPIDANGKEQLETYNRMLNIAYNFVRRLVESGDFQPLVDDISFTTYYNIASDILTGVVLVFPLTARNGNCQ